MRLNKVKERLKQVAFSALKHLPPNTAVNIIWASTLPRDLIERQRFTKALKGKGTKTEMDESFYTQFQPHGQEAEIHTNDNQLRYEAIRNHIAGAVIEVGCADGYFSRRFAREGHRTLGIDTSSHFIKLAKSKAAAQALKNIRFRNANAEDIPAKDCSFDTAFLGEILEHVERPDRVVQETARVVKPGGTIIITLPTHLMNTPDHVRTLVPKALKRMLSPVADIESLRLLDFSHYVCIAKRK